MILMDNSECKVIKSVSVIYLDSTNFECLYYLKARYEYLAANMTVNNLIKRNVSNPAKNSHNSNKPMFDQRSVYNT